MQNHKKFEQNKTIFSTLYIIIPVMILYYYSYNVFMPYMLEVLVILDFRTYLFQYLPTNVN